MRYVYTEKASKRLKDKKKCKDYFAELYPEEYSDALIAYKNEENKKASHKKAEKDEI